MSQKNRAAIILLGLVTAIWGVSFPIVKIGVESTSPHLFNAIRFDLAFFALLVVLFVKKTKFSWKTLFAGLVIGISLFIGYAFQSLGIQYTTATNSAFLTGLSVIFVPILAAIFLKAPIHLRLAVGVCVATMGLFLLSGGEFAALNKGDWMTIVSAFAFGIQIILVAHFARKHDVIALTAYQMSAVAIGSHVLNFFFEPAASFPSDLFLWMIVVHLAVFASAFALSVQIVVQRSVAPVTAAMVFAAEPIAGAIAGYFISGDRLGVFGYVGGAFVILGILIVENVIARPKSGRALVN